MPALRLRPRESAGGHALLSITRPVITSFRGLPDGWSGDSVGGRASIVRIDWMDPLAEMITCLVFETSVLL